MRRAAVSGPTALVLLLVSGAAAPAESPRQFDYVCEATLTITAQVIGTRPPPRKVTRRYSVDLDRNLWCWNDDACQDTAGPIARVTDDEIVFLDSPERQFTIRRRDGKLAFTVPALQTTRGTCRLETFTPITGSGADSPHP
ncbi:MAG: hypothetical protein Q8J89_14820 [Caulobacter sp.]|nr:hypothetical protein [Caulobacter sp.]